MTTHSSETRNLLVAVLFSVLILAGWEFFFADDYREGMEAAQKEKQAQEQVEKQAQQDLSQVAESMAATAIQDRQTVLASTAPDKRIPIETPLLHGSVNLTGARLDDLTLKGYRQELDPTSPDVALFSPKGSRELYFAESGWLPADKSISVPTSSTVWTSSDTQLSRDKGITLTWNNGQGLVFTRTLQIKDGYLFTITQSVTNTLDTPVTLIPYGLVSKAREDAKQMYISHEGPLGVFNEILEEYQYEAIREDGNQTFKDVKGWLGISDKYWLAAMIPPQSEPLTAHFKYQVINQQPRYQVDYLGQPVTVSPQDTASHVQHLYAGAKKLALLDKYTDELHAPLFDRAIDFGWLYFLTKPIFFLLRIFNEVLGNFGLAILLLTVIIKLLLFPLANKSYKSMAKMRLLMPEMTAIKERYGDDRVKMQQEMMKFYQEKRINPMAGCLPILVQIPIFFSLYKVLYITIEMRHAPFYGWIHDLSAKDTTNVLNLFGLLEYTPPDWLPAIGVLPLLFMITMIFQQKLSPPPTDPTQAMVMKWLPVIFVFLFASFPAGLVIYWTWSNTLSILQQWVITRKINAHLHHGHR